MSGAYGQALLEVTKAVYGEMYEAHPEWATWDELPSWRRDQWIADIECALDGRADEIDSPGLEDRGECGVLIDLAIRESRKHPEAWPEPPVHADTTCRAPCCAAVQSDDSEQVETRIDVDGSIWLRVREDGGDYFTDFLVRYCPHHGEIPEADRPADSIGEAFKGASPGWPFTAEDAGEDLNDEIRVEIARILELVAAKGLPGPRDLDGAIDAILAAVGDRHDGRNHFADVTAATAAEASSPDAFSDEPNVIGCVALEK